MYGGIMGYSPKSVKPNLFYDVTGKEKRVHSIFTSKIVTIHVALRYQFPLLTDTIMCFQSRPRRACLPCVELMMDESR